MTTETTRFIEASASERERLVVDVPAGHPGLPQPDPGGGHHRLGTAKKDVTFTDIGDEPA